MSSIKKHAVALTSRLALVDAADQPMFSEDAQGNPDPTKPMVAVLYGPGSKQFAKAQAAQQNRFVDRLKKKGKADQTADEAVKEAAEFLTSCTHSLENVEYDELQGEALFKAVYSDIEIGFVAEQVSKHIKEWGNFLKPSTSS